jgi:hypothetical protein
VGPEVRNAQPDKIWYTLPGYALVAMVAALQLMRRRSKTRVSGPHAKRHHSPA